MSIADKLTTVAENQEKVFEAGKTKQWSDFWDVIQAKGKRSDYNYGFYSSSKDSKGGNSSIYYAADNFRPKYNMKPSNASNMFENFSSYSGKGTINLEALLEECGVALDFSNCPYITKCFYFAYAFNTLPELNFSKVSTSTGYVFYAASGIKTIRKIIVNGATFDGTTFYMASGLENITFEGNFKGNTGFSTCPLTHESLISIINALQDLTGTTTTYKITLGSENIEKLTADELKIIEDKGWTYA